MVSEARRCKQEVYPWEDFSCFHSPVNHSSEKREYVYVLTPAVTPSHSLSLCSSLPPSPHRFNPLFRTVLRCLFFHLVICKSSLNLLTWLWPRGLIIFHKYLKRVEICWRLPYLEPHDNHLNQDHYDFNYLSLISHLRSVVIPGPAVHFRLKGSAGLAPPDN